MHSNIKGAKNHNFLNCFFFLNKHFYRPELRPVKFFKANKFVVIGHYFTGERPFSCNICEKKFARQDKLAAHNRIHTGEKPYKCQLCNYATPDGPALRKHMRIHTDERPHK